MKPPVRLLLLRHGEVEEPYQRVFGGRLDIALSPRGHEQAAALAHFLSRRPIDALYVSPMQRARQTLEPLRQHCDREAVPVPGFREVDFGDWTGMTWEQVHAKYNISAFQWLDQIDSATLPNGETGAAFRERVEPPLRDILQNHPGQSVAIVSHGGVIRMMLSILLGLPLKLTASFEIDYASVTLVEHHQHRCQVALLNFAPWRDLA